MARERRLRKVSEQAADAAADSVEADRQRQAARAAQEATYLYLKVSPQIQHCLQGLQACCFRCCIQQLSEPAAERLAQEVIWMWLFVLIKAPATAVAIVVIGLSAYM